MPRPPFPKNLREFQTQFATEEACQQYLARCRWPDGFVCPRCGHDRAYELAGQRLWQCAGCRHQTSVTAGTILHKSRTPLTVWFWAAYWMATDKRGVSALTAAATRAGQLRNGMDDASQVSQGNGEREP